MIIAVSDFRINEDYCFACRYRGFARGCGTLEIQGGKVKLADKHWEEKGVVLSDRKGK